MKKRLVLLIAGLCLMVSMNAQTLYVPEANGSTPGLGTSIISGNVGIGLSNPQEKLDLYGKISSRFYSDFPAIKAIFGHFGNAGGLSLISQGANNTTLGSGDIRFLTSVSNSGNSSIEAPTDLRMIIKYNGNVGIGTTNPLGTLHLNSIAPNLYLTSTNASEPEAAVRGNGGTWLFGYYGTSGNEDISIGTQDGTGLRTITFATGGSAKMKLLASGSLLIGKTSQNAGVTYKLDVAGSIRADEIKVNTTGADFVFDPTYKLRPLSEVETFIKANKHLPDVAPAAEMQANGVSMGEMQAKLLQKVEELTLYSIEQSKQLEEQRQSNTVLQQQLSAQAKEIEQLKQLITQKLKQ